MTELISRSLVLSKTLRNRFLFSRVDVSSGKRMSVSLRAQVISTEREDGTSYMAPNVLIFRYPRDYITSKSLIIVQPTEMAVVVIQGK